MSYKFTVPGPAVPQGRPIFTTRSGKRWAIDPPRSREYKAKVRACAMSAGKPSLITGAVRLLVLEYRPIPKSWSNRKQEAAREGRLYPTTRPDFDNIIKAITDALNGVFWEDDRQVVDGHVRQFYSDDPRVVVEVEEVLPASPDSEQDSGRRDRR